MTDDLKSLSENHNIWFVLASASAVSFHLSCDFPGAFQLYAVHFGHYIVKLWAPLYFSF